MDDDVTVASLDAPAGAAGVQLTGSPPMAADTGALFCPVRGVRGGAAEQLRGDTARILEERLRVALPLLAVILGVGAVRNLALVDPVDAIIPSVATLLLASLALLLWTGRDLGLRALRTFELLGFGIVLLGFAANHVLMLATAAEAGDPMQVRMLLNRAPIAYVLLILAYAVFIPNNWRRAAAVVSVMAATPLAVGEMVHLLAASSGPLLSGAERLEYASFLLLGLGAAAAFAVSGTGVISGYRRGMAEATEAGMYRLQGKLGAGGMGEVWRAEHRLLARPAAIKMIRPELLGDGRDQRAQMAIGRFRREARATAALESPHTVQLYDFGVTRDGTFFYVMEYLEGYDMADLVERFGPLPPARAIYLLRQAAESLAEAHDHGLVHRDIKPANLHVGRRAGQHDWVRVLDFGLVKDFDQDETGAALTREGMTTGTPAFFPPEMGVGAAAADARSDVYALGAVGFWLLTGQLVFTGDGPMDMVVRHMRDTPDPPSARVPAGVVPAQLDAFVLWCLEKKGADRPQSMREFIAALDELPVTPKWNERQAAAWWGAHAPAAKASVA